MGREAHYAMQCNAVACPTSHSTAVPLDVRLLLFKTNLVRPLTKGQR